MTTLKLKLNPEILSALIETSGYDEETISKKAKIPLNELKTGNLTLRQLHRIAHILQRPLAAFFSDEIPKLKTLSDYRYPKS